MSSDAISTSIPASAASGGRKDFSRIALIIGLVGLAVAAVGVIMNLAGDGNRYIVSWLIGFSFWFSMGTGMLFLAMIWYTFDARWPIVIRRQLEHAFAAFPYLALIFLPLVLIALFHSDPGILWKWINPDKTYPGGHLIEQDPLFIHKQGYLNVAFFLVRLVIYFGAFIGIAAYLRKCSFSLDRDGDLLWARKARIVSALGLPAFAMTTTFAAFDFYMSLSYHWFSTMYGVWFFATSMRAGVAATIIICYVLADRGHLKGIFNRAHSYDLGCIALAFTVFWAYISFSQYFLIYNANIPEETFWFNLRELSHTWEKNSWWYVGAFGLVFGNFVIPFLILLWYPTKVIKWRSIAISGWILAFFLLDLYFNILPNKKAYPEAELGYKVVEFVPNIFDLAALVGVGGVCVWAFLKSMKTAEPIPVRDPRIEDSVNHHE